jgi:maleylpyruvate isomerase
VRIGLAYKGIAYEYVPVNLIKNGGEQRSTAYRALNPLGQVPALVLDDGRLLTQSLAILEYLEETVPRPALMPADLYLRARVRQLAEAVNSGIQPLQNLSVLQRVKAAGLDEQQWARDFIAAGMDALEALAQTTSGRFLVGDEPTFADVCLVPQMYNVRRFQLDQSRWPVCQRVEQRCAELPAFQSAHADRQADAVPQ